MGRKGIFNLQEIGGEEQQRQAVKFDYLIPLRQVINLKDLISNGILKGTPQSMLHVSLDSYRKAVELGGIYAGSIY